MWAVMWPVARLLWSPITVCVRPVLGPASGARLCCSHSACPLGFNPWWDTEFEFEVVVPELALVRFVVEDYDASSKNDFIGQSTIPLSSLKQGECLSREGTTGRGVASLGRGLLSLEVPSLSDPTSLHVLLPAHPPARIPPRPPPVQEWRPVPVCHPLCEGGPLGLGLESLRGGCPARNGPTVHI